MKLPFLRLAFLALPLVAVVPSYGAIDPAIVSADARWLVYVDFNTLRGSALGKEIIINAEKAQLETTNGKIGLNWQKLLETVGSATAYGTHLSFDQKDVDGVLVFQGSGNLTKIVEAFVLEANIAHPDTVAELTDLPFPAYALHSNQKVAGQAEVVIAFPPEPIVIVSRSRAQLLKARDVYRSKAPSLAQKSDSPLAKFIPGGAGAYFFAASVVPPEELFKEEGPQARIFRMANSASFALGERGPDTFAHTELFASSNQMADKLVKILQGMTAMVSLAETDDKQLADFINSTAVNRDGNTVTLDLSYASDQLAKMMRSFQNRQAMRERAAPDGKWLGGTVIAEWNATETPANPDASQPTKLLTRTIENVSLHNGTVISLGRQSRGGKNVHFDRIEIFPNGSAGAPLVFRAEYMRFAGRTAQMQFPGTDGMYTLKVVYENDPEGKAAFGVSLREPKVAAPTPAAVSEPEPAARK